MPATQCELFLMPRFEAHRQSWGLITACINLVGGEPLIEDVPVAQVLVTEETLPVLLLISVFLLHQVLLLASKHLTFFDLKMDDYIINPGSYQ